MCVGCRCCRCCCCAVRLAEVEATYSREDITVYAFNNDFEGVRRELRKKKKKINWKEKSTGATALHRAACAGNLSMVEFLIHRGANINAKDFWGYTPLHEASKGGFDEVVEFLLDRGAQITLTKYKKTPLDLAEERSKARVQAVFRMFAEGDTQ